MFRTFTLLCLFAFAFSPAVLLAHRMPGSFTTIEVNEATGSMEIVHRLHRHDAELALGMILDDPRLTFDDLEARAKLALYVEQSFGIATLNGKEVGAEIALTLVGAELEGDSVLVYQELKDGVPPKFAVRNDILRDVLPAQSNQVNIAIDESVRTLKFASDDRWHTFEAG